MKRINGLEVNTDTIQDEGIFISQRVRARDLSDNCWRCSGTGRCLSISLSLSLFLPLSLRLLMTISSCQRRNKNSQDIVSFLILTQWRTDIEISPGSPCLIQSSGVWCVLNIFNVQDCPSRLTCSQSLVTINHNLIIDQR